MNQPSLTLRCVAPILLAALAACASNTASPKPGGKVAGTPPAANSKPDSKGGFAVPADVVQRYQDPLAASALRERALDLLTSMASDETPQARANVLEAMAVTPVRLEPLIPAALRDENIGVRSTAAMMLGKTQMRNLSPLLRPLLSDPSPYVRASAIYGLARCGMEVDPTVLAQILLNDPSPKVRAHVAFLLGDMKDASALPLLREAARTPVPRANPAETKLMQLQIAEAMVKLGDETQTATIRAALYPSRSEDLEATALAVQIIGQIKDRGAIDELIYLSAKRDQSGHPWPAEIRLGVASALGRMGLDKGTFIADEYAGNPESILRAQSASAYGEIGRPENLPKLDVLMNDPKGIVRVHAAAAILRLTGAPSPKTGT